MTALDPDAELLVQAARAQGVRDERLLAAIVAVPRARFVPAEAAGQAYRDVPIAIPHAQVTTQPSLVAQMIDALGLTGGEKVLEVGAGYGWQTALLAKLAREVWSVELWPDLAEAARSNLARARIGGAHVVLGDGSEGLPGHAPFDAVIVAAAFTSVPPPLVEQLSEGGRLVQPVAEGGRDLVTLFEKQGNRLAELRVIVPAHFVRLYGRHGYPRRRAG